LLLEFLRTRLNMRIHTYTYTHTFSKRAPNYFLQIKNAIRISVERILLGDNMETEGSCCGQSGSFVLDWTGLLVYVNSYTYIPYSPPHKKLFFPKTSKIHTVS
jgi:hypothetical protein